MEKLYTEKGIRDKKYDFIQQKSVKETASLHNHEGFYEMFLVTKGRALHLVNGTVQKLKRGTFVFVRPRDVHKYDYYGEFDFEFINFSFFDDTVNEIINFLDDSSKFENMLSGEYPPLINLSLIDTAILEKELLEFKNNISKFGGSVTNNTYKIYLLKIINDYFLEDYYVEIENDEKMPQWLMKTLLEMQNVDNFSNGLSRMIEIANCSQSHLTRQCKKHVGDTPTNIINNNRIDYSAYLLKTTNLDIVTIQSVVGFNNLSHFYHLFKKKMGCSPRKYRLKE